MDISDLLKFYASSLGMEVQNRLTNSITELWPSVKCDTFICHGFPFPFLNDMVLKVERMAVFMSPHIGVMNWPLKGKNITALAEEGDLPLGDDSVDRLLLLHSLEFCQNPRSFLREIWRVLAPEGRAIVMVPNRRSLWSRLDHTPFGHGNPYSMGQLSYLLKENQFEICQKVRSLYILPSEFWHNTVAASIAESLNKTFAEKLSGVVAIEVKKRVYSGTLPKERKRLLITPSPIRAKLSSRDDLG
ncbi:class I SAM-dependent methyltransferase [Candidatus Odyssella acanthamoebae]|uniref:class I SAM-dependent methyltransferase n=1 Tax=Candidatus Odyssella acanthamoebae TaxID=91604 RepID=UPI00094AE380|nr:class I SAM-dependent methyltransferase [Candidatus Paracaedibacter acanthamoebae]